MPAALRHRQVLLGRVYASLREMPDGYGKTRCRVRCLALLDRNVTLAALVYVIPHIEDQRGRNVVELSPFEAPAGTVDAERL